MDDYLEPYREATREFGPTFEATLWLSKEKQQTRFEVIASMVDLTDRVVVDAGCGLGDLALFLREREVHPKVYVGLEGVAALVEKAKSRGLPGARFALVDFVGDAQAYAAGLQPGEVAQVIVFSGSLNTLTQERAQETLASAWAAVGKGGAVVFNFLSTAHDGEPGDTGTPAKRFDPVEMLRWALERTPLVQLRHEYMEGHDATIAMEKPA